MPTIKLEVKNKIISLVDESLVVSYNKDYKVEFSFDIEWENENIKTARFVFGGKFVDVVIDGNVCDLPMIDKSVSIGVGVYAGDLHSTNKAFIPCIQSVLEEKGSPTTPTEDVYGQIIDLLNKYIEQGGGGASLDVKINGTSIVQDGVANIIPKDIVKEGIVTQTETLTDEEKTSACNWLGAATKAEIGNINTVLEAILGV